MSAATPSFMGFGSSQTRTVKSKIVGLTGTCESDPTKKKKSPYAVLKLKETATAGEIKAAYRALAKQYHPDVVRVGNGDGSEFVEIRWAYEALSDPATKAGYDCEKVARRAGLYPNAGFSVRGRWETDQCW